MTTITARLFEYDELKNRLNQTEGIAVFSCDNCARRCYGLGGQEGLTALADKLIADGFSVVCQGLFRALCSRKLLRAWLEDKECQASLAQIGVIIPLACQTGAALVRELFPACKTLDVTKTLGVGVTRPETGVRLVKPEMGLGLDVDEAQGMSLHEAVRRLGLYAGHF
jgi:hypothetical protein